MSGRFCLRTTLDAPRKGWLFLYVPDELLGGVRKRVWLKGKLNGRPFAATANPWREGTHVVTMNRQMRRVLGIDGPTEVELQAEVLDEPILDIEVPRDLLEAIDADPEARGTFAKLPPSHQKEFVFYLDEAKRPATRMARIRKSVAILQRGRHLWENPASRIADDLKDL
jgi:Bacteriocin-protection, YdeI or OmpD-Associated/Domain of unknown function (DUF1905)